MKISWTKKVLLVLSTLMLTGIFSITAYAGWVKDNNGWWYALENGGYIKNSWMTEDGEYYYFNNDGYMLANQWMGDYYLGIDGAMLRQGNTPDGYFVRDDGRWDPDIPKANWPVLKGYYEVSLSKRDNTSGVDIVGLNIHTLTVSGFMYGGEELDNIGYQNILFYVPDNAKFYDRDGETGYLTPVSRERMERYIDSMPGLGLGLDIINNTVVAMYITV
jgi:pneumococcal surface protein A